MGRKHVSTRYGPLVWDLQLALHFTEKNCHRNDNKTTVLSCGKTKKNILALRLKKSSQKCATVWRNMSQNKNSWLVQQNCDKWVRVQVISMDMYVLCVCRGAYMYFCILTILRIVLIDYRSFCCWQNVRLKFTCVTTYIFRTHIRVLQGHGIFPLRLTFTQSSVGWCETLWNWCTTDAPATVWRHTHYHIQNPKTILIDSM